MDTQLFSGHCKKKLFSGRMCGSERIPLQIVSRDCSATAQKRRQQSTRSWLLTSYLHWNFVNRLSNKAQQEQQEPSLLTTQTTLSDEPDKRQPSFSRGPAKLDPSAIYKLLKASDRAINWSNVLFHPEQCYSSKSIALRLASFQGSNPVSIQVILKENCRHTGLRDLLGNSKKKLR
jgi:hypothetical protein